jgi:hypothetical protein
MAAIDVESSVLQWPVLQFDTPANAPMVVEVASSTSVVQQSILTSPAILNACHMNRRRQHYHRRRNASSALQI